MSSAKANVKEAVRNNHNWKPTIDNMPLGYFERLNQRLFMGLPLTVAALMCTTAQILGFANIIHIGRELFFVLDIVTMISLIGYVQLPFALLMSLIHRAEKKVEVEEWANHGFFREGFEPEGYDLSKLKIIHNQAILQARLKKK